MVNAMIWQGIHIVNSINSKLKEQAPCIVILVSVITTVAISILTKYLEKHWDQTRREHMGQLALRFSFVKKKYNQDISKQLTDFQEKFKKKWALFTPLITTIPEEGWNTKALLELIDRYGTVNKLTLEF